MEAIPEKEWLFVWGCMLSPFDKFTDEDIHNIIELLVCGLDEKEIAFLYGTTQSTIGSIHKDIALLGRKLTEN